MKTLEENKYYIWLSSITEINTTTKIKLLEKYKNPKNIFYKTEKQLENELYNKIANNKKENIVIKELTSQKYKTNLDNNISKMKQYGINVITCEDEEYPVQLRQITDYPICLFCKGNTNILNNNNKIAIIGCREYSEYGKKIATQLSYELAHKGIIIVSGCARGIDSFSHKGCLMAKGKTIAILGNGLDYIYPVENKNLEKQIVENDGLLLSEYVIGTKPSKYTFPARNRIISGISNGLLVVEAKEKSGTLITVDFALEQGKNVYAVPGNINCLNSVGTNELIKQGAKLVTSANDILEELML